MREILFMKPIFKSMIWGGNRLRTNLIIRLLMIT